MKGRMRCLTEKQMMEGDRVKEETITSVDEKESILTRTKNTGNKIKNK